MDLAVGFALDDLPPEIVDGLLAPPAAIVVDVTNACNLRCPVCPVTIAMTRPRGLMSRAVFEAILADFRDLPHKPELFFNFSGEPTVNPLLPEFVRLAVEAGHKTFLSTNATLLSEKLSRALLEAGLHRVYLCLDGFDAEAQESYRIRSNFARTKANIERFVRLRNALSPGRPLCVLQTLLTRFSEGQREAILAWARAIGIDRVRFKSFSLGSYTSAREKAAAERFLPRDPALRRHPEDDNPAPPTCGEPLHSPVVFWDGRLGLCCIDYDQKVAMPSILERGFLAAWRSPEAVRARLDGYRKRHAICRGCAYNAAAFRGYLVDLRAPNALSAADGPA
ncbi:MAG: radical SAM protein [Geminicoccaceae bacterium]|nr:radical SAM protein [Geminicoccaceae bacterium]MCS7268925.1 radical SAM protein [Geminicoccaceae bacterium]MCX7630435.1 radical SAM protein [Geminicoccaceae bacterium]MDW8125420.1 radical SAM protein [Geminicoccaceae bacterium]MDW8341049.1 radical SAM protein [Geminicoccaceae bacterium]